MTSYNPLQATQGVLFPCHGLFIQFYVDNEYKLSCMMTQRSADSICGVPFNIASYALLVHIMCEVINNDETYVGKKFTPGKLIINLGDTHIYDSHKSQTIRQILREPYQFPTLSFNKKITNFENIKFDDIILQNYMHYPPINAKMVA
jgi:thymidylate synthase